MGALKEINRDDLLNRFASHTFTETPVAPSFDMTLVEFKDGSSDVVGEAETLVVDDAYQNIREEMVGKASDIMYSITTTQRDAMTISDETLIFNLTSGAVECYNGTDWETIGGTEWTILASQTVETTDDTQTIIDSFTLDDDTTYMLQINVVGTQADGSERCAVIKSGCIYRDGGSATIQGSTPAMLDVFSDGAWSVDITVSSDDVRAEVTGVAATTINWKCSMQFIEQHH